MESGSISKAILPLEKIKDGKKGVSSYISGKNECSNNPPSDMDSPLSDPVDLPNSLSSCGFYILVYSYRIGWILSGIGRFGLAKGAFFNRRLHLATGLFWHASRLENPRLLHRFSALLNESNPRKTLCRSHHSKGQYPDL